MIDAVDSMILVFAVRMPDRLKFNDEVGPTPVHIFAGVWDTVIWFTSSVATFSMQLNSILIVGAFVTVATTLFWLLLKVTVGLRGS